MRGNRADIFDAVLHHRISSDQDGKPGSGLGDFPAAEGTWGSSALMSMPDLFNHR